MSEDRNYEVGYRKPPKHTRFKPGQSGNPKGRKPGSRNVMTLLEEILFDTVKVRENGKVRHVPAIQACLINVRNQAIKGDPKAHGPLHQARVSLSQRATRDVQRDHAGGC